MSGTDPRYLVPDEVRKIIVETGCYAPARSWNQLSPRKTKKIPHMTTSAPRRARPRLAIGRHRRGRTGRHEGRQCEGHGCARADGHCGRHGHLFGQFRSSRKVHRRSRDREGEGNGFRPLGVEGAAGRRMGARRSARRRDPRGAAAAFASSTALERMWESDTGPPSIKAVPAVGGVPVGVRLRCPAAKEGPTRSTAKARHCPRR